MNRSRPGLLQLSSAFLLMVVLVVAGVAVVRASFGGGDQKCSGGGANFGISNSNFEEYDSCDVTATSGWLSEQMIIQLQLAPEPNTGTQLLGILPTRAGAVAVVRVEDVASPSCPEGLTLETITRLAQRAIDRFEAGGRRVGIVTVYCEESKAKVSITEDHLIPD